MHIKNKKGLAKCTCTGEEYAYLVNRLLVQLGDIDMFVNLEYLSIGVTKTTKEC